MSQKITCVRTVENNRIVNLDTLTVEDIIVNDDLCVAGDIQTGSVVEKILGGNIRIADRMEFGNAEFFLETDVNGDSLINFDSGDHILFDKDAGTDGNGQIQFKISTNPNPDVCISNNETLVSRVLKVGTGANFLEFQKETSGPDNRDVHITWEGTNITDYDDSADTITTTLNSNIVLVQDGGNNRVDITNLRVDDISELTGAHGIERNHIL